MAISGIGQYGGFYTNYRVTDIPNVDIETVKKQDELAAAGISAEASESPISPVAKVEDTRSRSANLDDISLNFNTGDDYSYIGSDSEIGSLDMQKAISDMHKDKILEDYQYFVGSAQDPMANDDGKVFLKF